MFMNFQPEIRLSLGFIMKFWGNFLLLETGDSFLLLSLLVKFRMDNKGAHSPGALFPAEEPCSGLILSFFSVCCGKKTYRNK